MSVKKIALVYDAIYPYVKGGAERRYYEFARSLSKQGYDVHLYGMKFWDGPNVIQSEGFTLHGIGKARPLYTASGRRSIIQALMFGFSAWKMVRADFDIIDCCGFPYFSLFPSKVAAVLKRKPLYATWHEVWGATYWREYLGKLGVIGYLVEKAASKLPNQIIACSDMTAARLKNELGVKAPVHIIPNGINTAQMHEVVPAPKRSDLVYVGRLISHKNVDLLIKALGALKQQGHVLTVAIVGAGPEEEALRTLAVQYGVDKQVTWHGFIPKSEDVYSHIKASRIFVLPSQREGFGNVVIEANACGKPVLTLDHKDNAARHLIASGKNGSLFSQSPDALARTIIHALQTSDSPQTAKSCEDFAASFDWLALTKDIDRVYSPSQVQ